MSCGCTNGFDGETITNEMEGLDLHRDNFDGEDGDYNNFGGGYTNFVDDGETDEYDNFLTKKMRERNQAKKDLIAGGMDKKEAKALALEQIPRDKLKTILARMKQGKSTNTEDLNMEQNNALANASVSDLASALPNSTEGGQGGQDDADDDTESFFAKNKIAVIGGGLVLALAIGYFAFGKKLGIRK
jgi:hypothetical protein